RLASGARAAASHTGSLAVGDEVFDAMLRQYGVLRARNEEQMLDMIEALCCDRAPQGRGVGLVTQSGGAGVMMADRAEEIGLDVPELAPQTRSALAAVLPAFGSSNNPVDVTGQFVSHPELLRESVVTLLDDPNVHVAIVWLQLMTAHGDTLVRIFREIRERTRKPFVVCWVAAAPDALRKLRQEGIPVFGAGERAVEAVGALVRHHAHRREAAARQGERAALREAVGALSDRLAEVPRAGVQPTLDATARLQAAGVPMAPVALARDADEAVEAWRRFGGPVVLKIESVDITHKTEVGGVLLRLDDEAAIRGGFADLLKRCSAARPGARIDGVGVQPMRSGQLELAIGVQRDPCFGMVVMVAIGGVLIEVLKDVSFRIAPFSHAQALEMLQELRMHALFEAFRGRPALDRDAVAALLSKLSVWAAAMQPWLQELDLNPLLLGSEGASAVDCVMVLQQPAPSTS
ncbi:MAG: acetate--CoA ligase family protein, partial [Betaproteobacteria bacterium]|nr:acetate--CoA ligase family protein [Betaproteobacteria bacterium]